MLLPHARGPLTQSLREALRADAPLVLPAAVASPDILFDDDAQLALWICFELHYQGFDHVDDDAEWRPDILDLRRQLETLLLTELRRMVSVPPSDEPVADRLRTLVDSDDGPGLSRHLQTTATAAQWREFLAHRAIYQLKEADPHTWAIPRLRGRPKAALVEIQRDEYGDGIESRMHSTLYRQLLTSVGMSDAYDPHIDAVPGITLALSNVMSLFGLRRSLRGALAGHLTAYEMTSSAPCRRYAKGVRRVFGHDADGRFFDVHVTADALHEQVAAHDLCGALATDEPNLAEDILFGAACCLYVDARFAEFVLGQWSADASSLRMSSDLDDEALANAS